MSPIDPVQLGNIQEGPAPRRTHALLIVAPLFCGLGFRPRVNPKFYPDVGELVGIGEPAVTHHRPQGGQAGGGEEQTRQPAVGIERHVFNIVNGKPAGLGGNFQDLELADGRPLSLPISLDGGAAKQIIVRTPVMVPTEVAQAIAQLPQYKTHSLASLPLEAVERDLAAKKLDFVGNKVEPMIADGQMIGWSISSPFKTSVSVLAVTQAAVWPSAQR